MLTEETNKEAEYSSSKSGGGNSQRGVRAGGDWQRKLARSFPYGFPDSATAAETGREPAGARARQEQIAVPAGGSLRGVLLLFFGVFSRPKQKISLPGENPRGEASLGRKVTPGQENSDPTRVGDPDAECGCAFRRSSAGWPIDAGGYRPDLANRHGAQDRLQRLQPRPIPRRIMR